MRVKRNNVIGDTAVGELKVHNQWRDVWQRLCSNRLAIVGMGIVIFLVLIAIFADIIAPYDYSLVDPVNRLQYPSITHWFGTDNFGRDILSRVIYGGRTSLLVSILSVMISLTAGGLLGSIAGYFGGKVDTVIMRVVDVIMSIPGTLLAVCISALLGSGIWQTAIAIAISGLCPTARTMRATALSIRNQEYIEAGRAGGSKNWRIIRHHVIPNCIAPLIVDATMKMGGNIMMISSLSFIGLGVQPPTPEWGAILNAGREYIEFWPIVTFPGLAIMLTVFGFNVFGDGLRDALDPKMKR